MNDDLIVFGEDWGGLPSSTQHLIRHLAPGRRTLWVNSIGLRRPRLTATDLGRAWSKGKAMLQRLPPRAGSAPFPVLAPRALPWPGNPAARFANRRLLRKQVSSAARSAGLSDPILWTSLPTAVDLAGSLGEKAVVYYCGDDFGALAGVDHEPVVRLERELVDRADLILAASPQLAERFPGSKTHLLPHGVDLSLFSQPAPTAPELPRDGPVAGFYGSLAEWLDLDLIAEAAWRLPHWRFVLIGEFRTDVTRLRAIQNISLLGPRPHNDLPSFSQHWQASLLPFKDNAQIRASNPLKLREYLAAGRPVVATDFPALDGYRDLLNVVKGPDELAATLEATLAEPSVLFDARRKRVAGESWSARADQVAGLMETLQ